MCALWFQSVEVDPVENSFTIPFSAAQATVLGYSRNKGGQDSGTFVVYMNVHIRQSFQGLDGAFTEYLERM